MSATTPTTYEHIVLDEGGVPWIKSANTKVVEVVRHIQASGLTPEQLHLDLPHLTLGQIHSALAYFWDHRDEVEADLRRRDEYVEQLRKEMGQPPFAEKLLKTSKAER